MKKAFLSTLTFFIFYNCFAQKVFQLALAMLNLNEKIMSAGNFFGLKPLSSILHGIPERATRPGVIDEIKIY